MGLNSSISEISPLSCELADISILMKPPHLKSSKISRFIPIFLWLSSQKPLSTSQPLSARIDLQDRYTQDSKNYTPRPTKLSSSLHGALTSKSQLIFEKVDVQKLQPGISPAYKRAEDRDGTVTAQSFSQEILDEKVSDQPFQPTWRSACVGKFALSRHTTVLPVQKGRNWL